MLKNKKLLIIYIAGALIIIGVLIFWLANKNSSFKNNNQAGVKSNVPAPQFLNDKEKLELGLPPETRVQSLNRDANGAVTVYKVITSDADIIRDPSAIQSISPRRDTVPTSTPIK